MRDPLGPRCQRRGGAPAVIGIPEAEPGTRDKVVPAGASPPCSCRETRLRPGEGDRLGRSRRAIQREKHRMKYSVTGFAAMQHYIRSGLGRNNRRTKPMSVAASLVTLVVLLAVKVAVLISAKSGRFDDLPRPNQID